MNRRTRNFTVTAIFLLLIQAFPGFSQQPPFWNDIQKFKQMDSAQMPPSNGIVFTGSSSFTKWTDLSESFPGYPVINRGFGGSSLPDVIRYADDVIFKYNPKQVVIYCGENDAVDSTINGDTIATRFITLFKMIREKLPKASIAFVSMKPSPSRLKFRQTVVDGNAAIKKFISKQKKAKYIDVFNKMLDPNGYPVGSMFVQDSLHMSPQGYQLWQGVIRPYLKK